MTPEITSMMTRAAGGVPSEDTQQLAEAFPTPGNLQHHEAFPLKETSEAGPST